METKVGGGGKLQPVDKEQKYTDEVNWRIKWQNGTGVNYTFVGGYAHTWDLWRTEIVKFLQELKNKKII